MTHVSPYSPSNHPFDTEIPLLSHTQPKRQVFMYRPDELDYSFDGYFSSNFPSSTTAALLNLHAYTDTSAKHNNEEGYVSFFKGGEESHKSHLQIAQELRMINMSLISKSKELDKKEKQLSQADSDLSNAMVKIEASIKSKTQQYLLDAQNQLNLVCSKNRGKLLKLLESSEVFLKRLNARHQEWKSLTTKFEAHESTIVKLEEKLKEADLKVSSLKQLVVVLEEDKHFLKELVNDLQRPQARDCLSGDPLSDKQRDGFHETNALSTKLESTKSNPMLLYESKNIGIRGSTLNKSCTNKLNNAMNNSHISNNTTVCSKSPTKTSTISKAGATASISNMSAVVQPLGSSSKAAMSAITNANTLDSQETAICYLNAAHAIADKTEIASIHPYNAKSKMVVGPEKTWNQFSGSTEETLPMKPLRRCISVPSVEKEPEDPSLEEVPEFGQMGQGQCGKHLVTCTAPTCINLNFNVSSSRESDVLYKGYTKATLTAAEKGEQDKWKSSAPLSPDAFEKQISSKQTQTNGNVCSKNTSPKLESRSVRYSFAASEEHGCLSKPSDSVTVASSDDMAALRKEAQHITLSLSRKLKRLKDSEIDLTVPPAVKESNLYLKDDASAKLLTLANKNVWSIQNRISSKESHNENLHYDYFPLQAQRPHTALEDKRNVLRATTRLMQQTQDAQHSHVSSCIEKREAYKEHITQCDAEREAFCTDLTQPLPLLPNTVSSIEFHAKFKEILKKLLA